MSRKHENYQELIWMLAKTDFKLRYHGSVLGYLWALLKPLLTFLVLNFVFSSIFAQRGIDTEYYSLQLLVAVVMMSFFSEGSMAGMQSLLHKSQLVTKIYIPRWTIILASTLNSAMIYIMNLLVVVAFFAWNQFLPSFESVLLFILFSFLIYTMVIIFAFFTAPLYVKFRDLVMIWEVLLQVIFYATPVFYSLQLMPPSLQQILLINPMAFIVHFTKESLILNHFPEIWQLSLFVAFILIAAVLSMTLYKRLVKHIAEEI
jgi:ABC-type polysaccharide/polyol phosphate export permease